MLATTLAQRLRHLRERENVSQEDLADMMGINDRQTVSAIENARRSVSASELVLLAKIFKVDLDVLTDPFSLIGEGKFSWRQKNNINDDLNAFELRAGRWVGAYRELRAMQGEKARLTMGEVRVSETMSYEDAWALGEHFAVDLDLGPIPAIRLQEALVTKLDTLVLFIDAIDGVSGAACRLPNLNAILINRRETLSRRNFDLGHELFHLLTWTTFPPQHVDPMAPTGKYKRVEQLAENFASSLLMPRYSLEPFIKDRGNTEIHDWLNRTAIALCVSSISLRWRLVNSGVLTRAESDAIDEGRLSCNGQSPLLAQEIPPLFNKDFMQLFQWSLEKGRLSARRAASILGISIDELAGLFRTYELDVPFDL